MTLGRRYIGQLFDATVLEFDGEAAPRAQLASGHHVRLPGGVPGDRVRLRVVGAGQHSAWGEVIAVLKPSPDRVAAPCPIVDQCGGCPWQATAYSAQLRAKEAWLSHLLRPFPDVRVDACAPSPVLGYRTKVQMPVGGRKGALMLGFWARGSRALVPVEHCVVQDERAERIRAQVVAILDAAGVTPFDEVAGVGELRTILVRLAAGRGEAAVVLVTSGHPRDYAVIAEAIVRLEGVTTVWLSTHQGSSGAVLGESSVRLAGAEDLRDRIGDVEVVVSPTGFSQTNPFGAAAIISALRELAPPALSSLLDLYGGSGLLALAVAPKGARVTLVESHADAVRRAHLRQRRPRLRAARWRRRPGHVPPLESALHRKPHAALAHPARFPAPATTPQPAGLSPPRTQKTQGDAPGRR